jgi:hypothetical protein
MGALALKSSVYVLPNTAESLEDFQWLQREIEAEGGEATVCGASLLAGVTETEMEEMFRWERNVVYEEIVKMAQEFEGREATAADVERVRHRLEEVVMLDFFDAPGRVGAEHAVRTLETRLEPQEPARPRLKIESGLTWVTRVDVRVDRIASAWLIRRSIDPSAAFKFVPADGYEPEQGELRFDMFDGEFTHQGSRCTFETLVAEFDLQDPALQAIAEVVHDIDCKDEKFGRPETAGIASVIRGIALAHEHDAERIRVGADVFDGLCSHFENQLG